MHFLNVEAGVPSRLLMYTLIYWLCRMHTTQLQLQFLGLRAQWSELKRHLTYSCSHVSSEHALSQKGLAINLASCGLSVRQSQFGCSLSLLATNLARESS